MTPSDQTLKPDVPVITLALAGVLTLAFILQHEFQARHAALLLIGAGLGVTLFHALFGFTGAWRNFIVSRRGAGIRAQILLIGLTSLVFFPLLGGVFPELAASGAVAPVGVSVFVGAFMFGIGMQLGGGCGSGTLYTVGGGHVDMLITLACFIAGATLGSAHLHWWLALPSAGRISFIDSMGWLPALLLQAVVLWGLYLLVQRMEFRRHGTFCSLNWTAVSRRNTGSRLILGPWPLWWGIIGLAALNLATLLVAGHPWSITFAFGLWGTKIWSALGGDIAGWPYWSAGYPAKALGSSVLADTVSLMDFGIVLGAILAAALAGKFAPAGSVSGRRVITAVIGGLLLGYGARLAFGCNIGGLLAGIASGSLHGWLWLVAGFAGNVVGVRLRPLVEPQVETKI